MEIGQMGGFPLLIVIGIIIIYFYMKKPNDRIPETNQDTFPQTPTTNQRATNSPNQSGWISTKSQQPEYYKTVTIFTVDNETLYNWARVNDGKEDYYIHPTESRTLIPNEVTHWMDIGIPK